MGEVIAVVSGKGGTGKTTFTALVGTALARLGYHTLCLDCDVGLRNLDLALGLSDRALMDFTDVAQRRCPLEDAAAVHPKFERLHLLTAPVSLHGCELSPEEAEHLFHEIRLQYAFCLIDASAGLGDSFRFATRYADRVIVVSGTDSTSLRDAQRTVMELRDKARVHLVINRLQYKVMKSLHRTIDDAIDMAGLPLLGVIPEDDSLPLALARGAVGSYRRFAPSRRAGRNIALRLTGRHVPLMDL